MDMEPSAKRHKGSRSKDAKFFTSCIASFLLEAIPDQLGGAKIKNDMESFQTLFERLSFRTSIVQSPRRALSVYLDSCGLGLGEKDGPSPRAFLATLIGMNPRQDELETHYASNIRSIWCLLLFCQRIQKACDTAMEGENLQTLLIETIEEISACIRNETKTPSFDERKRVAKIRKMVTDFDTHVRTDQLDRELDRIHAFNSTLTNAIARKLFDFHAIAVKDAVFKDSHLPQYRRLSFYLYDPEVDESTPPPFLFLPCLSKILRFGPQEVVQYMVKRFWAEMLKRGYFASKGIRMAMEPKLNTYFQSGLKKNPKLPLVV